ncbi:MAG: low molecular weight phosphotyrosine protein phosphatase [Paramuribaculum sp.]|nr:low molecular weight phosphotyrosine protein phosphatase [Paramuribaculum sp.]
MILENLKLPYIPSERPVKVLFVCLGNICRSPAAEGMMKETVKEHHASHDWEIDSAGTASYHAGDLPDSRMRTHALRRGLVLDHICRKVKPSDYEKFDLIIGMDDANISDLVDRAPSPDLEKKIVRMADFFSPNSSYDYVPDPYYEGAEGFELVLDLLADATLNLFDTVEAVRGKK